jgi:hypothetical protein
MILCNKKSEFDFRNYLVFNSEISVEIAIAIEILSL